MRIISERAKVTTACAGVEGFDAEVVVESITDKGFEQLYIHANAYEGEHYTVSKKSLFDDDIDDLVFLEEYESLEEAKASDYYKYFEIADRMLNELTQFN